MPGEDTLGEVPDTDSYGHKLYLSNFLRESVIRAAIEGLRLPSGSRGLDAGCGIGSHVLVLAEAVAPEGHVTGLDASRDFLARARETAAKSSLSERVSFRQGNVNSLPFDEDTFDWVWSADCVGFIPGDPVTQLKELARVVRPGGTVAIILWSSQALLPGHPVLEARLNATSLGTAPFVEGRRPELHFLRALGWMHDAGLEARSARTFVGDVHAPLSPEIRSALLSLLEMRWGEPRSELSEEEWGEYRRLCRPESPDFILDVPGYYAFFTYSMFRGTVVR